MFFRGDQGWSWIPRWSQEDVERAAAGELNYHHVRHPMTSWIHAAPWKGMFRYDEWYWMIFSWHWMIQSVSVWCCMMLLHDVAWCVAILDMLGLQKNVEYFSGDLRSGLVLTVKAEHCSRQVPREAGRPGHCRWREEKNVGKKMGKPSKKMEKHHKTSRIVRSLDRYWHYLALASLQCFSVVIVFQFFHRKWQKGPQHGPAPGQRKRTIFSPELSDGRTGL